ncbi:hypothetical protein Dred_2502 [Desulforamulus reducens MI-1]|uniref:Uncharacterized protein n=1 Tax=Desulforamulus reducens (strain ATCC BAA-1160 / DSM 100696 / MI-1) TaxID=349161 RepID=A4J7F9_DESRM|nr:hypothetical protein [Desulforamulus reducens]ABO51012.1 hypothetical protein Dred_2502 [Desulforamulus reducens MI-1]
MLRNALLFMLFGAFVLMVGFGVYIANECFNSLILPEQPVQLYSFSQEESGNVRIQVLGETLEVNTVAMQKYAGNLYERVDQNWQAVKNNPQVNEKTIFVIKNIKKQWQDIKNNAQLKEKTIFIKEMAEEKWEAFLASERVKAVNQWVQGQ